MFSHEITHHFEVTAPQTYTNYKAAVLEVLENEAGASANEQIDNTIKLYSESGINLTYDEAVSELVADYTKRLITDADKIREFMENSKNINYEQKTNILKGLFSAIKDFINKIKTAISNRSGIDIVSELKRVQNTADILERMIAEAAGNTNKKADVKYSIKPNNEVAESFGITKPNDYVHIQKHVNETLLREGFFSDEGGRSRTVTNAESGMVIEITPKGIKETLGEKNYMPLSKTLKNAKLFTLRMLPKLIESGQLISDNVKNMHNSNSGLRYAYIQAYATINNNPAKVRIAIRKSPQKNRFWVHQIDIIKSAENTPAGAESSKTGYQFSSTDNNILQKEDIVNRYNMQNLKNNTDAKFSLKETQSVTEEDVKSVQAVGRKSVNDFTSEDISKTETFARKYFNELGEKSPYFRAWFGDWRANDTTPIHIVTEKGSIRKATQNKDTSWDIQVSGKVFNETKKHISTNAKNAISYLDYINSIVENAILLDSYAIPKEKMKSENSVMMHSFYALADSGNGIELVKMYVEEMRNPNTNQTDKRSYQLQKISKIPLTGTEFSQNDLAPLKQRNDYTVADLFRFVKQFDKNFNPKEASKVVNDDGTPKVVYHGTDAKFTVFDITKSRSYDEVLDYDLPGFYFSENQEESAGYSAGNVGEYYINISNPFDGDYFSVAKDRGSYRKAYDYLVSKGYDGVIEGDMGDGFTEYIVFNPEQIKSASGNVGTFDKNNSDVRYSIKRGKDNTGASLDNSIKLPYNEYKQLREYVMMKNNSRDRISAVDCKEIGNNFYIWKNNSKTDFEVTASIPIDGNEEFIDYYRSELNANDRKTQNVRELYNNYYAGQRDGVRSRSFAEEGRRNGRDDNISSKQLTRRKTHVDGRENIGESSRNTSKDNKKHSIKLGGDLIDLAQKYGKIPKGEKAARDVSFPKQISDKQYVSQYARTAAEAGTVPNDMVSEYEKAVLDGRLTYERISDKSAIEYAENTIKKYGFEEVLLRWNALAESGHSLNKKDLALGDLLHVELAKHGDSINAMKVFVDLTVERTRSAQNVQSSRLLKMLSADGQLYYIEKTVLALNEEMKGKLGDKYKDIELDGKLLKQFLEARTNERRNEIYDKICLNIAEQIPATGFDKWNAWRYLSMLGNPRTHIRNIVGNAVFYPAVRIKGYIAAGLERTFLSKDKRTTSIKKSKESKAYAAKDFLEIKKELQGVNAKFAITDDIESKRQIFKVKALEYIRKTNSALLEIEDLFFLKRYYEDAFARFMTARGISTKFLDSGTPEASKALFEIRKKAIQEAQEATYRDANTAAEALTKLQRNAQKSNNKAIRAAGIAIEGVLPFKKTPLNIVKRGIEYSPIGLTNGIWNVCTGVKKGKLTAAEAINKIAKGITGTGLCMLGYILAHFGLISGSDEEDKKKRKFDGLIGKQSYALCFGGKSYTIDWMAPINLPLFVGVELRKATENEELSFAQVINAISTISGPILELSCLSGASNVVEATQYNDTNVAMAIVWEIATSYLTQAIPTAFGQVARAIDSKKRNVYYKNKESSIPADIQILLGEVASKVPGLGKLLLEPKIDLWGREETYGVVTERLLENFISPGFYSKEEYTEVDKEIDRLYKKTGDNAVLPTAMGKNIAIKGQKYNLNVHEYTEAAKLRGRKSFELVKELISSSKYKKMNDIEKVKSIQGCYTDALDYVKSEMVGELEK